jgi:hypothetical protein
MKRATAIAAVLFLTVPTFAADQTREQKRLEVCGQVLKEILDIPDELPKDLPRMAADRRARAGASPAEDQARIRGVGAGQE